MKALTLTQPWASLILLGHKRIETRGWAAPRSLFSGCELAIHAGKNLAPVGGRRGLREICEREPFQRCLFSPDSPYETADDLPLGVVLLSTDFLACHRTEAIDWTSPWLLPFEHDFGDYSPGRWAWNLGEVRPFPVSIPAKGHQKIWEWTP